MCILGCSCSDMCLKMLLFGGSRKVLHEGLVGVGAPDVAPSTIKSFPAALSTSLRDSRVLMRHRASPVASCPGQCVGFPGYTCGGLVDL
ncbi:hypothetical protein BHM03_00048086 [Ensete ventricosum]|nr:hypothetical protein BHM03_00048086 [Ensete ventricosum]